MGILEIFKKKKKEELLTKPINLQEENIIIPESNEIINLTNNNILDTDDKVTIAKFKHNLKILYKELEEKNKIDKFVIIREDNFYPYNNEWLVNSKETEYEEYNQALSIQLKKRIQKNTSIYMPTHFRSTKHFTINTPLGATGSYNGVEDNRNFIVIDSINNLIDSEYTYSIAPQDAYVDVSHEPLKISNDVTIMINQEKYNTLKDNEELMADLKNKKVIIYKGDEVVAIQMVLTEMGILPSKVGTRFYEDNTGLAYKKTEESLKEIAKNKNIMYNQSHGGEINGHFSSKYDDMNNDWNTSLNEFISFLKSNLENIDDSLIKESLKNKEKADELINLVGEEKLFNIIQNYNERVKANISITRKKYCKERTSIPSDISEIFKKTVKRINIFYKNNEQNNYSAIELNELEENIRLFFQSPSIEEQIKSSSVLLKKMNKSELNDMFSNNEDKNNINERGYII